MVDINKVVNVDFNIQKSLLSIGSYKKVLFVTSSAEGDAVTNAKSVYTACGGDANDVVVLQDTGANGATTAQAVLAKKKAVSGTEDDFIFVVIDATYSSFPYADFLTAVYGADTAFDSPYKIIPCASIKYEDSLDVSTYTPYAIALQLYNDSDSNKQVAMAIPAYFSNINLDYNLSVMDYCYTDFSDAVQELVLKVVDVGDDYDALVKTCNFVDLIAKRNLNFGGNLANGISISTQFAAICAENDVVYAVAEAMFRKQYLTNQGLVNIVSYINNALARYVTNGFLQKNSAYSGNDYVSSYNGKTLITKGTTLPTGYYIATISMSQLKTADRAAKKFTPITIFMETQSGARVVEVGGIIIE